VDIRGVVWNGGGKQLRGHALTQGCRTICGGIA